MPTVLFAEGGGKWGFLVPHIMETWAEKDRDILEEMRHVRNELTERKPPSYCSSASANSRVMPTRVFGGCPTGPRNLGWPPLAPQVLLPTRRPT
jgi:hypothetical protein